MENPCGKNHGSTRLQLKLYAENIHNGELQGDDLELVVLATGGGNTQRRRPLISLTAALSTFTPLEWKNKKNKKQQ